MESCCWPCLRAASRAGDSPEERKRKEATVPVMVGSAVLGAGAFSVCIFPSMIVVGTAAAAVISGLVSAWVMISGRLPLLLVEYWIVGLVLFAIVPVDWALAGTVQQRLWPMSVLCLDQLLVTGARPAAAAAVVDVILVWLAVQNVEAVFRFGLYERNQFSGDIPADAINVCFCADPPCATDGATGVIDWLAMTFVFVVDYHCTRGFATGMREREAALSASIEAAESAGERLARYDTDAAQRALEDKVGAQMPARLRDSLQTLVANLEMYRPYLPQSVLSLATGAGRGGAETEFQSAGSDTGASSLAGSSGGHGTPADAPGVTPPSPGSTAASSPAGGGGRRARAFGSASPRSSAASPSASHRSPMYSPRSSNARAWRASGVGTSGVGSSDTGARSASRRSPRVGRPKSAPLPASAIAAEPARKAATLLALNRRGFLPAAARASPAEVSVWALEMLSAACASVAGQRGIVDLIAADHVLASFGAVRACASQRQAAPRAAATAAGSAASCLGGAELPPTAAACSALALCGDFGGTAQRRFMVIGGVSSWVVVLDRLAARWAAAALSDAAVHADCAAEWHCRLRGAAAFAKAGGAAPQAVWELTGEREAADTTASGAQEWLYQLGALPPNCWGAYNTAMELWASGCAERARQAALGAAAAAGAWTGVGLAALELANAVATGAAWRPFPIDEAPLAAAASAAGPEPAGRDPHAVSQVCESIMTEMQRAEAAQQKVRAAERDVQERRVQRAVAERRRQKEAPRGAGQTDHPTNQHLQDLSSLCGAAQSSTDLHRAAQTGTERHRAAQSCRQLRTPQDLRGAKSCTLVGAVQSRTELQPWTTKQLMEQQREFEQEVKVRDLDGQDLAAAEGGNGMVGAPAAAGAPPAIGVIVPTPQTTALPVVGASAQPREHIGLI